MVSELDSLFNPTNNCYFATTVTIMRCNKAQEKNDLNDIDRFLKPLDTLLSKLDVLNLPAHLSEKFLHGQKINLDQLEDSKDLFHDLELYRVYNKDNFDLLGVASINNNIIVPKRVRKNRD